MTDSLDADLPEIDEAEDWATDDAAYELADLTRMLEAILFASAEPVSERALTERLPHGAPVKEALEALRDHYRERGVSLVKIDDHWAFRTADDLAWLMSREQVQPRKLSRAALEVLAIIAYHQPTTRAEIEEIRGVDTARGTLDTLMESGWVKIRGRRRTPGRPVTYGTTVDFLDQFGLEGLQDLPGLDELKGAGLLSSRIPGGFSVPSPNADPDALTDDEDPLTDIDLEELGLLTPKVDNG